MTDQLYNIVNEIESNSQEQDDSLIFSNENFKFIKYQFEKDDDVIYKAECLKETNVTENENVDIMGVKNEEINVIEMIEYIEKKNIPEEKKQKEEEK